MQHRPMFRLAAVAATLTLAAASSFAHQEFGEAFPSTASSSPVAMTAEPATRADVRHELLDSRQGGAALQFGEIAETPRVIAAREQMNQEQAVAIADAYRAEQEQRVALAAAEEVRAQAEYEGALLALAEDTDAYEVYAVYMIDSE